ncbi:hypothetical protein [Streptomyces flaveolus]|uniref:Uncharacterized protein n=1 Tax=Streptomyces flaveolus TaxID=67297 RepID=A0ABV3AF50_9ACTN
MSPASASAPSGSCRRDGPRPVERRHRIAVLRPGLRTAPPADPLELFQRGVVASRFDQTVRQQMAQPWQALVVVGNLVE